VERKGDLQASSLESNPVKLLLSSVKAPYEYISDADPKKLKINHRGPNGKVITQNSNVLITTQSKLDYLKNKEFRYTECPDKKETKDTSKEPVGHPEAFRTGSPHKNLFTPNSKAYFDADIKSKTSKKKLQMSVSHDGAFRPSCTSPGKDFTPVIYKEEGKGKEEVKPIKK
jgi:hypothetical protein